MIILFPKSYVTMPRAHKKLNVLLVVSLVSCERRLGGYQFCDIKKIKKVRTEIKEKNKYLKKKKTTFEKSLNEEAEQSFG